MLVNNKECLEQVFNTGEKVHYDNMRTWKKISTKEVKNKLECERSCSCIDSAQEKQQKQEWKK